MFCNPDLPETWETNLITMITNPNHENKAILVAVHQYLSAMTGLIISLPDIIHDSGLDILFLQWDEVPKTFEELKILVSESSSSMIVIDLTFAELTLNDTEIMKIHAAGNKKRCIVFLAVVYASHGDKSCDPPETYYIYEDELRKYHHRSVDFDYDYND